MKLDAAPSGTALSPPGVCCSRDPSVPLLAHAELLVPGGEPAPVLSQVLRWGM
jgi:hypothetical protein